MEKSSKFITIILKVTKMIKTGNIGVIVTRENGLMIVRKIDKNLIHCEPIRGGKTIICTSNEFWVLLDDFE